MDASLAPWTEALDGLEQFVEALRTSVVSASGDPEGQALSVPALPLPLHLGPVPPALRVRAATVLRACSDVEEQLAHELAGTRREMAMLDRMRPERQDVGRLYLDQSL